MGGCESALQSASVPGEASVPAEARVPTETSVPHKSATVPAKKRKLVWGAQRAKGSGLGGANDSAPQDFT